MKTATLKTLPKFYISRCLYGSRRDNSLRIKYVPCRTYTKEQREKYF